MKKNLILMSALFAGSMFMNDGFGMNGNLKINNQYQMDRADLFAQNAVVAPQYRCGEVIVNDNQRFEYFIETVRYINTKLAKGIGVLEHENPRNVKLASDTFNKLREFIGLYEDTRNGYLAPDYVERANRDQTVIAYNGLVQSIQRLKPIINYNNADDIKKYYRAIHNPLYHDNFALGIDDFFDEDPERERKEAEEARKARIKKYVKYGLATTVVCAVGAAAYYLGQQYLPAVMASFSAVSYTILPFSNATRSFNVTVSRHWGMEKNTLEFKCNDYNTTSWGYDYNSVQVFKTKGLNNILPHLEETDNATYNATINTYIENCSCGKYQKGSTRFDGCVNRENDSIK